MCNDRHMDIRELKLFLKLAETLHYARTSQVMAISPSALSRTVQRIEDEVGEKLFERDNRSVQLTKAGHLFREYAVDVIDRWNALQESLAGVSDEVAGSISVYSSVTGCYQVLPGILEKLRKNYPGVHVNLITGSVSEGVSQAMDGNADIVIAAKPDVLPSTLEFREVFSTPMVFIAPAIECSVRESLEVESDWGCIPMILPDKGMFRKRIDRWFREQEVPPLIYSEVSGNEAIIAMVRLGFGVGALPEVVVKSSLFAGDVEILNIDNPMEDFKVGLLIQKRRMNNPCVQAFLSSTEE